MIIEEFIAQSHIKDQVSIVLGIIIVSIKDILKQLIIDCCIFKIEYCLIEVDDLTEILHTYTIGEISVTKFKVKLDGVKKSIFKNFIEGVYTC